MKKVFFSVAFALVMLCGFGQNVDSLAVDSLIKVSQTLAGQRNFDKSLEISAVAEKLALEKFGRESALYGRCCFNRGRIYDTGSKFTEAEKWYLEAMAIREKTLGKEHPDYATSLNNLAVLYFRMGQYEKPEMLLLESKNIREKVLGKEHPDYATSVNSLAILYAQTGRYEKAEPFFLEAKAIYEKSFGKESSQYASSLGNIANLYSRTAQYIRAEPLLLEALSIREKLSGKEDPGYANALSNLANLYVKMSQNDKAEPLYLEAKDIREKLFGKEHPDYASSLNSLAGLYEDMGQYDRSELLYLEAKDIRGKLFGKKNPDYANTLSGLATLYRAMGRYEKAEPLYLEVKNIWEKTLGKDHPSYAGGLNNLANLYVDMGQYEKAEPLNLEAKAIREKILGKEHPDYANSLNNLASLYTLMGQYEKAEALFLEAKTSWEKMSGRQHPEYGATLNNLAGLYENTGQYEKAESLYLEVKAIREKTLGKDHPIYATTLDGLGVLYRTMGQYEKAEPLYLEAKAIYEKSLGKEHLNYALNLNNLAIFYRDMGQYEKAELLHLEAKAIWEKTFGKEHPDYGLNLNNLASLYYYLGQYEKAEPFLIESAGLGQTQVTKGLRHLSERELENYLKGFSKNNYQILSFIKQFKSEHLEQTCFDNILFYKGFLLNSANQIKRLALSDSITAEKFDLLKSYGRRLAVEYAKPIAERRNVAELEEKANALEKELVRSVTGFGEALQQVNWQQVRNSLKPGEGAIEFIHFRYYDRKGKVTDSILYAALLLRPGWPQPRMVGLFEEKALQSLFSTGNSAAADRLYAARGGKKRGQTNKSEGIVVGIGESANLYQLIWEPLDSLLQGAKTVYFSPSGLLHRLNLAAIPIPGTTQTLADRYKLVQMGSTRQLVTGNGSKISSKTAALFGGLRFDSAAASDTSATTVAATYDVSSIRRSLGTRGGEAWNYLPGTEKEVASVGKTLSKSGYSVQPFTGYDGSESVFKSLGTNNTPSPSVLHLATHGFFFPDPKDTVDDRRWTTDGRDPVFKTSDNPLMRSGLLLAGANHAWAGGKTPEGQEDGILTAYEISQINLANTELVVLSACETGLGDLSGNEGVYGLQRAFKIAGAKYLMMSLWQVPDQETSEFMGVFYKKWLEDKKTIPDAFRAAQKEMRERGLEPYQWAGFVLVE